MELCCDKCVPSCDYCKWARHGDFERDGTTWPIGCKKHPEEEYQAVAKSNGCCPDFRCLTIKGNT